MRVSFVLTSNQDIKKIVAKRIQLIESNFSMEISHIKVSTLGGVGFSREQGVATAPILKQALDKWDCTQKFEVQLEFREVDEDAENTIT